MTDEYEDAISAYCDNLKDQMLTKYKRGRIEHGGSPTQVDCNKEIHEEVLDILNYHLIDRVNKKGIEITVKINGEEASLSDISEEALAKIRGIK